MFWQVFNVRKTCHEPSPVHLILECWHILNTQKLKRSLAALANLGQFTKKSIAYHNSLSGCRIRLALGRQSTVDSVLSHL